MLGELISAGANLFNANQQAKNQKEFAQNSISWKAADAERAGISKIFAMGAPATSYAPVSIGSAGADLGNAANKALSYINGQGGAGATTSGKVSGISTEIQAAQLDGLKIDNDIKRAELASKVSIATQAGAGGTMDRDVIQGPTGLKIKKEIAPAGSEPQKEFGVSPEVAMFRTKHGYAPQIPKDLQEAFESDMFSRWQWNLRNKILPGMGQGMMDTYGTKPYPAPPGQWWDYDPLRGEYRLMSKDQKPYYSRN